MIKSIDEKLKPVEREQQSNQEKEKLEKIFQAKSIGRPSADFETRRQKYCDMLNKGQIKTPKPTTLEYYKIIRDEEDTYVYLNN